MLTLSLLTPSPGSFLYAFDLATGIVCHIISLCMDRDRSKDGCACPPLVEALFQHSDCGVKRVVQSRIAAFPHCLRTVAVFTHT